MPSAIALATPGGMNMLLCMRTTIDMPDRVFARLKRLAAERRTTLRALILEAVENNLGETRAGFSLRDAAVGGAGDPPVPAETIDDALRAVNEPFFRP